MKPQEISNQKGPIPKQSSSKKSSQRTTIKKSSKTGNNLTENQSSFKKSKNMEWLYSEDEKLYDMATLKEKSKDMKQIGDEIYKRK